MQSGFKVKNAELASPKMEAGRVGNHEDNVNEVKICNICGDAGFEDCLARCSQCSEGAEHGYCMRSILDVVPADWVCEGCTLKRKETVSKKRPAHHELESGQVRKKQILSRVLLSPLPSSGCRDAGLLRNSLSRRETFERKAEQFVSMPIDKGLSRTCTVQSDAGTTLKETLPGEANQLLIQTAVCLETGKLASTSGDRSHVEESLRTNSAFCSKKTIGNVENVEPEVKVGGIVAPDAKLALTRSVMMDSSPIEQSKDNNSHLNSLSKPLQAKLLPAELQKQELCKPAGGFISSSKGTLGPQRDSAKGAASDKIGCEGPSNDADTVKEAVDSKDVSKTMGSLGETSTLIQHVLTNNIAVNYETDRCKAHVRKRKVAIRDFPIITRKIKIIDESSESMLNVKKGILPDQTSPHSGVKGLLLLGSGKETSIEKKPKEGDKGIDGSSMPSHILCESEKGLLTREDSFMKERAIERHTEDSCIRSKATEGVNEIGFLPQPPSLLCAKAEDRNVSQEGEFVGPPSDLIDTPTKFRLKEASSVRAPLDLVLVKERKMEFVSPSTRALQESSDMLVPRQERDSEKRSDAGLNKAARVLLRRISRRDSPSPKSQSTKLDKSAVLISKEVTSTAGQEVTPSQDNRQVNGSSFLAPEGRKVTRRDFPIVSSKALARNLVVCTSSNFVKSHEPQPGEAISAMPSSSTTDMEAANKVLLGKSKKVERVHTHLHQTTLNDEGPCCDNTDAFLSSAIKELPRNNASSVMRIEPASGIMTAALHSERALEGGTTEKTGDHSSPSIAKFLNESKATTGPGCPRQRAVGANEQASVIQAEKRQTSERLPLSNVKDFGGCLISSTEGELVSGSVQHHFSKQKGGTEDASSLTAHMKSSSVSVSGEAMNDGQNMVTNKEAAVGNSSHLVEANGNHEDKGYFAGSAPVINPSMKRVRFSVDGANDSKTVRLQTSLSIKKDLKKDGFLARHGYELNHIVERCVHNLEDSRCGECDLVSYKRAYTCRLCGKIGHSTEFCDTNRKDIQRDWRENDLQNSFNRGSVERRLESGHMNRPRDPASYLGACRCGRCNEGTVSSECCKARSMDKQQECGRKGSPNLNNKQREWRRRDSPDLINNQREWRKRDSPDLTSKQREWRRKASPEPICNQREWRRNASPDFIERSREWRATDATHCFEEQREWRRKASLRRNDSFDHIDRDLSERRHAERPFPGFQGSFDGSERWRSDLKERTFSDGSHFESGEADSANLLPKRMAEPFEFRKVEEENRFKQQSREGRGFERESLGLDSVHHVKVAKSDTRPIIKPSEYTRVHERQIVRVPMQDTFKAGFTDLAPLERPVPQVPSMKKVMSISHQGAATSFQIEPSFNQVTLTRQGGVCKEQVLQTHVAFESHGLSRNYVQERSAFPSPQVLWIGCFTVTSKSGWSTCYKGIQAHPSTVADPKVCEAMLALPFELKLEEVKREERTDSWPWAFQHCLPTRQSVGIYFAPKDLESDGAWFQPLVNRLHACGLILRVEMEFMVLLIFPSQLLPEAEQCWDGRFFLWGIFTRNKNRKSVVDSRPLSERDPGSDLGSPEGNGEVIDMDVDMVGGRAPVSSEWQDFSPPLPPGFLPPPPPPGLPPGFLPPPPPPSLPLPPPPPLPR